MLCRPLLDVLVLLLLTVMLSVCWQLCCLYVDNYVVCISIYSLSFSLWYLLTFCYDLRMYQLVHFTATLYSLFFAVCRNGRYCYTSPFEFLLRIIIFCEGRRGRDRMNWQLPMQSLSIITKVVRCTRYNFMSKAC